MTKPPAFLDSAAPAVAARTMPRSAKALMHELHVHQVELELQNEELRRTQLDLAAARDRFIDLYDFAPVGYLTLDFQGEVLEANLTGSALLGEVRKALLGQRFVRWVVAADESRWQRFFLHAMQFGAPERIELSVRPRGGAAFHAQLDCVRVDGAEGEPVLRVALSNITPRKVAEMDRHIADTAVHAVELERRNVSRQLHEELGQRLSALKMELATLCCRDQSEVHAEQVSGMLQTLDVAVATIRRIATDLRPLMLDDLGLNEALDWLARDSARRLGLAVSVHLDEVPQPLSERVKTGLYRLVQEMLVHVARHGQASDIDVDMRANDTELVLTVRSSGSGWPVLSQPDALMQGTLALHERAHLLRAALELADEPGGGQRITVRLPLAAGLIQPDTELLNSPS